MGKLLYLILFLLASPSVADVGPCPITADFVTEPETSETVQKVGEIRVSGTTMRAFVVGGMVQIECTGIDLDRVFPGNDDASVLRDYARFWSIQPTGKAFLEEKPVPHYVLEGKKDIQGYEVIYTYHLFRFDGSFAMVATGVPGGEPTSEVLQFLNSIEVSAPDAFSDAERAEGRKNHMASCIPAIRADNEKGQLGLSEVEIAYFCSCTGIKYFEEFTSQELRALAMGNDPSLNQKRTDIQTECFDEALK